MPADGPRHSAGAGGRVLRIDCVVLSYSAPSAQACKASRTNVAPSSPP